MTTLRIPDWLADMTVSDVVTFVLILAAAYTIAKKPWRPMSRLVHLIDDLAGEDARPGVPARPGLMERVATVEQASADNGGSIRELLTRFEPVETAVLQLLPNHGHHVADTTRRTEDMLRSVSAHMGCPVPDRPTDLEDPPE